MEKIKDWDKVEAKGMEDFKALPIGAYECKIINAVINHNEESGKDTLKVMIDIASGEYKDYFKKRYDNNTNTNKKWDNNATRYLAFEGNNIAYFKGFITCVENSNVGYKWNWDEATLRDKKICGIFQYEEYENLEGKKGVKVRLNKFRSLDKMKEANENLSDNVKLLNGNYMSIDDYNEKKENSDVEKMKELFGDVVEIKSEDLLF